MPIRSALAYQKETAMATQIITLPTRYENVENFCPLCGTHNFGESVDPPNLCDCLVFIYSDLMDGIVYLRDSLNKYVKDLDDIDDIADALKNISIDDLIIFEEFGDPLIPHHFMIAYQFSDLD